MVKIRHRRQARPETIKDAYSTPSTKVTPVRARLLKFRRVEIGVRRFVVIKRQDDIELARFALSASKQPPRSKFSHRDWSQGGMTTVLFSVIDVNASDYAGFGRS